MNCRDCEYNKLIPDPDPHDWFRDGDLAMVCTLTPNPNRDITSVYASDHSKYRPVVVAVAYDRDLKESRIPDWCPLGKKNESLYL